MKITRRSFLQGTAAVALAPTPAFAQVKPVKIGLLTVKTGPLAAGGIQVESLRKLLDHPRLAQLR